MYGGIKEIMNSQEFLEQYANSPVETIDADQARQRLLDLGIITESGEISPEYKSVIIKSKSG